ncbi:MAG: hypothetical protein JNJ57_09980 [Saprospiraceae bacterium]|nr:hypothetical protein [Saprospiraceae bacterium]
MLAQFPPGLGAVACPAFPFDLELHSGDSGTLIPETYEQLPIGFGGATVANKNDSDADGIVDNVDPLIFSGGAGLGEDFDRDLMKLTIYKPQGCPTNGEVLLNVLQGQGKVNFFEKQNKENKINNFKFKCNELQKSIFMEITDNSQTFGDIEVELNMDTTIRIIME